MTAETDELAQQKLDEYRAYASPEAGLAHYSVLLALTCPNLLMMNQFLQEDQQYCDG